MNDSRPPPRKAVIGAAPDGPLGGAPGSEAEAPMRIVTTRDSLEGARAFFEKRGPERADG